MTRKPGLLSLLLMGLAAFGLYKYSKMSDEQKRDLKEKGKKLVDENIPQNLKNVFGKKEATNTQDSYTQV